MLATAAFWLLQFCAAVAETTPPLPTATPTIFDSNAPDPQKCPGYKASHIVNTPSGFHADLTLAGSPCDAFGIDISDLTLEVSYQAKERLNVRIQPKYIGAANSSWFLLDSQLVRLPEWDGSTNETTSDLKFTFKNDPTFQFAVSRQSGEVLFSTFGHVIVYETQFVEIVTNMVDDYNVYGLAENIRNFRLGTNYTQTLYNVDSADAMDANSYGTHPFYQETRYGTSRRWGLKQKSSTAHGVYIRNAHAQEWLMRSKTLTFRAIGGSLDLYFLSGQNSEVPKVKNTDSTALNVFRQYQQGCVGLPAMQMYWTLGFHQSHWGWSSISDLVAVVSNYSAAGIPLESIWNDIDVYDRYRIFTNNPDGYESTKMHQFVEFLHSRGQHYVAIQDSNVYVPDPSNASDIASYPAFSHGADLNAFIRDGNTGDFYIGENWPGYSVWTDWLSPSAQEFWTNEVTRFHELTSFDALWVDLNEIGTGCSFSCGSVGLKSFQTVNGHQKPPVNARNLNFPPYTVNHVKPSKQLFEETIALNAFHNDEHNTVEYDVHSLWSIGVCKATYNAIKAVIPKKRPFIVARSTFAGSGQYAGHWGGDNEAKWGAMALSISQSFIFQMSGIPMFGVDTCGFEQDTTEELCARWMELSAFFPFYRNHYSKNKQPQEAYVWPVVAEASRRAIGIRYSLLSYIYTLLYLAHTRGDTVMRALTWEFPDDSSLRDTDTQFLLGPSLLVTPVLEPQARSVRGVFPGIGSDTRWFDWYTLEEIKGINSNQNVSMNAPIEHINLHIRGGSILVLQEPGNTTASTRLNPYTVLITPDVHDSAHGSLYLDDGESIDPSETRTVEFSYHKGHLEARSCGEYLIEAPLAGITVAGLQKEPRRAELEIGPQHFSNVATNYYNNTLRISGLEWYTLPKTWSFDLALNIG